MRTFPFQSSSLCSPVLSYLIFFFLSPFLPTVAAGSSYHDSASSCVSEKHHTFVSKPSPDSDLKLEQKKKRKKKCRTIKAAGLCLFYQLKVCLRMRVVFGFDKKRVNFNDLRKLRPPANAGLIVCVCVHTAH